MIETPQVLTLGGQICPKQIQVADGCHLEKSKNLNIFSIDWLMLTKFGMLMSLDPLDPVSQ